MDVPSTPFAVLTTVVAPAILTNACSVLALGTANRIARVVDRTRAINAELPAFERQSLSYGSRVKQLAMLRQRSVLLVRALRLIYGALGFFAAAALLTVLGSALGYYEMMLGFSVSGVLGLLAGILAVGGLVYGSTLLVRETQIAMEQSGEEVEEALRAHQ
ncbi:MAG: DUF2721 domain-containing protein [Bryobacteraceae bacterium]|nr:DUF2721 domain-containing protein [Bryobacteraceae bacterium]